MGTPAYFEDAADYHDWWTYSGTGLGATSAGETFEMLDRQLSEAGANAVIAYRFLDENDRGIDLPLWRRAFVFGHVGLQVSLTLRALGAIGAAGIVKALRESPGQPSLISMAQEMMGPGNLDAEKIAGMIEGLRGDLAAGMAHVLGDVPEGLRAAIPQPRSAEGVETREEVGRLLDAYVAAHRADLDRDVAKYGDPRKLPGFDPEAAAEERARKVRRLGYLSYQRGAIDGLREQLDRLRAAAKGEPAESPRLNKVLRKVMSEHAEFAGKPPEDLTREVRAWLGEVEQFRDGHPDLFAPKATPDERVNARLAAIGPYEVSFDRETPSLRWDRPAGLDCDWTDFRLAFEVILAKKPAPSRVASALDALCDEWGRLQARWPELRPGLERHIIDLFRGVIAPSLPDEERAAYLGEDGELSEAKILAAVEDGAIMLTRHFEEPVHTQLYFDVSWDEEHGVEVEFDEEGEIARWF